MGEVAVTVRMYRRVLGDCFLITVGTGEERSERSHILIDCGILQGIRNGKSLMREIVEDIVETTEGEIDCLIVTHEHFDHIGGFQYARDIFENKLRIGTLWFAWTEDPEDPKGRELQRRFGAAEQKMAALRMAIAPGGAGSSGQAAGDENGAGFPEDDENMALGLASFMVPSDDAGALAAGATRRGSQLIYDNLRQWARAGTQYLEPGDVLETPTLNGAAPALRAYVLGPPRADEFLFKGLPTPGAKETYFGADGESNPQEAAALSPFAPSYRWWINTVPPGSPDQPDEGGRARREEAMTRAPDFVRTHYLEDRAPCRFAGADRPPAHDCETDFVCRRWQEHRRIDNMLSLEQSALALRMDSNTNNSSLVIAFELPDQSTMVFAADAQVGNWLSWEEVRFRRKDDKAPVEVTTAQLLGRARLYKVGHHGSHNATLAAKGLELMTSGKLVAMIPTVEAIALQQGRKGWLMPNPETYRAIARQTRGRILRGDLDLAATHRDIADKYPDEIRSGEIDLDTTFTPTTERHEIVEYRLC